MAVPARSHDDRVRAAVPPGLRPCLERAAPLPARFTPPPRPDPREQASLDGLDAHLANRSGATRRAYASDWRRWWAWCARNDRSPLPAAPEDVALYLALSYLTDPATGRPRAAAATIDRWSAAIGVVHTAHRHPTPTTEPPVAALLRVIRANRPGKTLTARPLTDSEFTRLLQALPPDTWPEAVTRRRDRLVLTLARATGLGPDALLNLPLSAVRPLDGPVLHVDTAPEPLLVRPAEQPLECAVCAFAQWRELLDIADHGGATALETAFTAAAPPRDCPTGHACAGSMPAYRDEAAALLRRLHRGGAIGATRPGQRTVTTLVHTYARQASVSGDRLTAFSLRRPAVP